MWSFRMVSILFWRWKIMSEELKKGIPKGRVTGKKEFTEEERKKHDKDFENILKQYGVLKKNQSINDMKHPG